MSETIDWTTVAVPQDKKADLEERKPDHLSWGEWIEALATDGDVGTGGVDEDTLREIVGDALADVEDDRYPKDTEAARNARVLSEGLMQRLQDMDEVVRESAYEGAKEALEE